VGWAMFVYMNECEGSRCETKLRLVAGGVIVYWRVMTRV
jgi:hypothetical protein